MLFHDTSLKNIKNCFFNVIFLFQIESLHLLSDWGPNFNEGRKYAAKFSKVKLLLSHLFILEFCNIIK